MADVKIPDEDFDFNKMFAKFKKEEFFEKEKIEVATYDKDDFFDSMSSDVNTGSERPDFRIQRRIDGETFGTTAAAAQRNVHRQARGRGGYHHHQGNGHQGGQGGGYNRSRGGRGGRGGYQGNNGYRSGGGGGGRDNRQQQRREYA